MEKNKIFEALYQVWLHCGQEARVRVVGTYASKCLAEKVAGMHNAAVRHDTRPDLPPRRYYYVRPVAKEQLYEVESGVYRKRLNEERKRQKRKYHKVLLPLVREMAAAMVFCLEITDGERLASLRERGGWLEGYRGHAEGIGDIVCSALFSGMGEIALEVGIKNLNEFSEVETFRAEYTMKSWLLNTRGSASALENRIIDIVCSLQCQHRQREEQEREEE